MSLYVDIEKRLGAFCLRSKFEASDETTALLGASGCGKSMTLKCIAGIVTPDQGRIVLGDRVLFDSEKKIDLPPQQRRVGYLFQQYALFPWLTVLQNVMFGLKLKGMPDAQAKEIAMKYIKMVQLEEFVHSYPKELSGGMKQRVAIARAYAVQPEVLLMDEPFGALDAQTRTQLQSELIHTWQEEKKTCFFITHDVEEAIILANKVIIMSARPGRIKKVVDIDLPYPRTQEMKMEKPFLDLKAYIWGEVYKEYLEVRK